MIPVAVALKELAEKNVMEVVFFKEDSKKVDGVTIHTVTMTFKGVGVQEVKQ